MFTRNNILKYLSIGLMSQENKFKIIEKNHSDFF
jgi:hypothetical protein